MPDKKILPFGEKAHEFAFRHPSQDSRLTILEGSVRSSKTWSLHPKLLQLCDYKVGGVGIITGVSKDTVYTNVLNDLFDIIGKDAYRYNRQSGELELFGSWWKVIGAKDEGSEKYIRGATVGKWIGDELTEMPKSFFLMALSRLSPAGSRMYGTTNPDTPFHYLKTDFIDNKELRDAGELTVLHFDLDDNPHLTTEYKNFLKMSYKGVFYKRFIQGLWVVAEGVIYRDAWSDDLIYTDITIPKDLRERHGHIDHFVSVDYGTVHPMVFHEFFDDGHDIWLDREYFYDSVNEMRQKTDKEYADDLEAFLGEDVRMRPLVIIPPECASFEAELIQRGVWFMAAENEVAPGIQTCSQMMSLKRLHVHERCEHVIKEIGTYAWDEKKAERGLEEPVKQMDDAVDCMRYGLHTKIAPWRLAA